ncbi:AtuA-related protein [Microbacterium marinilacus]|uniref:AtuA-like ferredoxin-fold domain-containing protein n=1 Tax=Microbacterium marinilacus TaxID=415209 RepID=A0ABP7BRV6_9MICO|nr:hypothetical protein [Microbacterium marinilacus]MBY0690406.1 hypothetical protein [Microbacterium marinilacus]
MILADIAHARAGDKGVLVTIAVVPHDEDDYGLLTTALSEDRIRDRLGWLFPDGIVRHELPSLRAMLIVGRRAADDDVTVSLAADRHGKTAAGILLAAEIPETPSPLSAVDPPRSPSPSPSPGKAAPWR